MASETILIVDDNQQFARTLIDYMLKPAGYRVIHADNGQAGIRLATDHEPDLILLDMHMPHMTGLQVLEALRQTDCRAPVLFMTGEGTEAIAVKAFRLGVRDYLVKPFDSEILQEAVDRALAEIRLVREKEKLTKDVIVSETVRQTVVTLSHYLNNYLMVLNGNLFLLSEGMPAQAKNNRAAELKKIITDCQRSAEKIETVLHVLQRVTKARMTTYHGKIKMIDIEKALKKELGES